MLHVRPHARCVERLYLYAVPQITQSLNSPGVRPMRIVRRWLPHARLQHSCVGSLALERNGVLHAAHGLGSGAYALRHSRHLICPTGREPVPLHSSTPHPAHGVSAWRVTCYDLTYRPLNQVGHAPGLRKQVRGSCIPIVPDIRGMRTPGSGSTSSRMLPLCQAWFPGSLWMHCMPGASHPGCPGLLPDWGGYSTV